LTHRSPDDVRRLTVPEFVRRALDLAPTSETEAGAKVLTEALEFFVFGRAKNPAVRNSQCQPEKLLDAGAAYRYGIPKLGSVGHSYEVPLNSKFWPASSSGRYCEQSRFNGRNAVHRPKPMQMLLMLLG
jgi:hypothetical protein